MPKLVKLPITSKRFSNREITILFLGISKSFSKFENMIVRDKTAQYLNS
jgi:hypothetical protein